MVSGSVSSVFYQLNLYRNYFLKHSFFKEAIDKQIPSSVLMEFALYQYSDGVLWVPMLSLMKSKIEKSTRLRKAIEDNICCETGIGGVSHVELVRKMINSLNLDCLGESSSYFVLKNLNFWLSQEFEEFTEPMVVGWLLVAETLVPIMFEKMQACFAPLGCDTLYFSEHVSVDGDEHSRWMSEAAHDVVAAYGAEQSVGAILHGMREAWLETISVPDLLYQKVLNSRHA